MQCSCGLADEVSDDVRFPEAQEGPGWSQVSRGEQHRSSLYNGKKDEKIWKKLPWKIFEHELVQVGSRSVQVYAPSRFVQETVSFSPKVRIWQSTIKAETCARNRCNQWLTSDIFGLLLRTFGNPQCRDARFPWRPCSDSSNKYLNTMQKKLVTIQFKYLCNKYLSNFNHDSGSCSAPRPTVTGDVRIATMSNFAPAELPAPRVRHWMLRWTLNHIRHIHKGPAACARCAFCAKVQFLSQVEGIVESLDTGLTDGLHAHDSKTRKATLSD